jgi:hypothetical protein
MIKWIEFYCGFCKFERFLGFLKFVLLILVISFQSPVFLFLPFFALTDKLIHSQFVWQVISGCNLKMSSQKVQFRQSVKITSLWWICVNAFWLELQQLTREVFKSLPAFLDFIYTIRCGVWRISWYISFFLRGKFKYIKMQKKEIFPHLK